MGYGQHAEGNIERCVLTPPSMRGGPYSFWFLSYGSVTLVEPGMACRILVARVPIKPYWPVFWMPSPPEAMTWTPPVKWEHGLLGTWRDSRSVGAAHVKEAKTSAERAAETCMVSYVVGGGEMRVAQQ